MPPELDMPRLETRRTRSADGTLIAYYATDPPRPDAPVLVLANGLAGHHRVWAAQLRYFGDRYRIVTWDYRGLFGSAHPVTGQSDLYGMVRQIEDLQAVLRAEDLGDIGLIGWSVGVQVALEAYRRMPERIRCLVLVNGAAGRPFDGVLGMPLVSRLVTRAVGWTGRGRQLLGAAMGTPVRRRRVARALRLAGLVAPTLAPELVERLVGDISDLSLSAFDSTLRALAAHDASDVLPTVTVPTLVMAGARDPFTPPALAHRMARALPNSDILVVPQGRHFLCLEFPDLVNLRLEQFLQDADLV